MTLRVFAQGKSLDFIYIVHDHDTPVNTLCDRLTKVYENALDDEDRAVIFYLSNADNPHIVKVNLQNDNPDDFSTIISELHYRTSHEVSVSADIETIPAIFDECDFIDKQGNPAYTSFELTYYVTPDFWKMRYNESIIANLYFILDLDKLPKTYFKMRIWHSESDGLAYDKEHPFGLKDLCKDFNMLLLEY